jgi:hypothetical protein
MVDYRSHNGNAAFISVSRRASGKRNHRKRYAGFDCFVAPSFGECSMQGNAAATTIAVSGTYYKISGTTALSGNELLFDNNSTNTGRLRYIGAPNRIVLFSASCSLSAASNNQVLSLKGLALRRQRNVRFIGGRQPCKPQSYRIRRTRRGCGAG